MYLEGFLTDVLFHHADKGATRPVEMLTLGRRENAHIDVEREVVVGGLREVERNLCGLTMGVPPLRRQDVPLYLYIHTMGFPESLNYFLR